MAEKETPQIEIKETENKEINNEIDKKEDVQVNTEPIIVEQQEEVEHQVHKKVKNPLVIMPKKKQQKVTEDAKGLYDNDEQVTKAIKAVEKSLNGEGRVLIRASGTEALIRVMIEGLDQEDINKKAKKIADVIEKKFGA